MNFAAPRDLKRWSLRGSLIDHKLEANSTIWNVDQHNVKMQTSYGFSRHTKVVGITTLVQYSLISWKLETHCAMNMESKTSKYLLNCHRSSTPMTWEYLSYSLVFRTAFISFLWKHEGAYKKVLTWSHNFQTFQHGFDET